MNLKKEAMKQKNTCYEANGKTGHGTEATYRR